jgi:hypothetical protein
LQAKIAPIARMFAKLPEVQFSSWASGTTTLVATRMSSRQAGALGMQQRLGVTIAALVAAALVHVSSAAMGQGAGHSDVRQIELSEKQVQGVIAAQKDVAAIFDKLQGPPPDELPPKVLAELDAAAKKHGFKDFNDYDEVVGNITMVMTGMDPKTKSFTEPAAAIQKEIADVTADKTISAQDKKQMLEELNEALKSAQPIQFPGNIDLVKKYYDKIDAGLN